MNDDTYRIMCRNIAYLRKQYHLNQKEMAEILGIGVGSLRRIERGEMPPRIGCRIFNRIYDTFGIFASKLLSVDLEQNG